MSKDRADVERSIEDRLDELEQTMDQTRGTMEELRRGLGESGEGIVLPDEGPLGPVWNLPDGVTERPLKELNLDDPAMRDTTLDELIILPGDLNEKPLSEVKLEDLTEYVNSDGSPVGQWVAGCGGGNCAVIYNGEPR